MTSTKIKAAYFLFLVFFSIWVTVLWLTCFPSGAWANPVRFPNILMLTLFMVSGSVAAVSCAVIGIDYLGIDFGLRHGNSVQIPKNQSLAIQECPALVIQESGSDTAGIEKLQEPSLIVESEETEQDVLVLLPTEEEETTEKNSAQNQ